MSSLFRREAIDHQRDRFHGAVVLTNTWSSTALTLFLCAAVAAVVAFACFFGFARQESVSGMLTPDHGLLTLVSPQAGVIAEVHVQDGQEVRAGDPLFTVSNEQTSAAGATQSAIAETLVERMAQLRDDLQRQQQLSANRRAALGAQLTSLRKALQQQEADLQIQQERLQMLRDIAQRFAELLKTGTVTEVAAKEKWAAVIEQQARIATQQHDRLQLQQQQLDAEAALADLPLQTARETSRLQREIAELQQQRAENESRRRLVVRAEQPGRVVTLTARPGQTVAAAQPLAELLPAGSQLEAELLAPTRAIGLVRPGTEVALRYEAYPHERFGQFAGRVRDVSATALPAAALPDGNRGATPLYRVRVQLNAQDVAVQGVRHPLRPGMQVSASLVLEHRTLLQWVLEPLYGLAGRGGAG